MSFLGSIFSEDVTVNFGSEGFFGYGEKGNFSLFSIWHFLPIILLIGAIVLTYFFREKIRNFKHEKIIRLVLASLMLLCEMGYYWRIMYVGTADPEMHTLLTKLPLQICERTCIFGAIMLLTEMKSLFDIDVFVCLTVGILPLIFPTVISTTGPAYARYYQFWGEHLLPIYAVFYMMFVKGFKYDIKKVYKSLVFLSILTIICIPINYAIPEASYLYLQGDTIGKFLADVLPDNQFGRLGIFAAAVIGLYGVEFLIFFFVDRFIKKKNEKVIENNNAV